MKHSQTLREKLDTPISFIKTDCCETELCSVKTNKHDYVVPKKTSTIISCRVNHGPIDKRTPVLFEPDELAPWPSGLIIQETLVALKPGKSNVIKVEVINSTEHDITLRNCTPIGRLEPVQSVTPVEVKLQERVDTTINSESATVESDETKQASQSTSREENYSKDELPKHLKAISLDGLTSQQRALAVEMPKEHQDSFAEDDSDVGSVQELQMNISLKDNTPVVPRPLYPEVKSYIEDLLNRQFINPSSPGTLCRWCALRSYANSMWLAFNSGRVTQECEKKYLLYMSFFLKTLRAMEKHFKNILTLIY